MIRDYMKAWFVFIPDEWGELVHATTRGRAKALIMQEFGVEEYIFLGATRVKGLDNRPITFENCDRANFHYVDEDGNPLKEEDFFNVCKCDICRGV